MAINSPLDADALLTELQGMAEATYLTGCGLELLAGGPDDQSAAVIALGKRMTLVCDELRAALWPQAAEPPEEAA